MSRTTEKASNGATALAEAVQPTVTTLLGQIDQQRDTNVQSLQTMLSQNLEAGKRLMAERTEIAKRLQSFGVVTPVEGIVTEMPVKRRGGRPKGSKNKPKGATVAPSAVQAAGRRGRRPSGESATQIVFDTLKALGPNQTAGDIAEAVQKKYPNIKRQSIDSSLQALRGKMKKGKQVGKNFRIKASGEERRYVYTAI